jgi:hypothetical protein
MVSFFILSINSFVNVFVFIFGVEIITEEQLREGKRQLERHKATTVSAYSVILIYVIELILLL